MKRENEREHNILFQILISNYSLVIYLFVVDRSVVVDQSVRHTKGSESSLRVSVGHICQLFSSVAKLLNDLRCSFLKRLANLLPLSLTSSSLFSLTFAAQHTDTRCHLSHVRFCSLGHCVEWR